MSESQNPLISIVLPVYNSNGDFLRQAIDSCLTQTWQNLELLLVNDASTSEETLQVLAEVTDSRVSRIDLAQNGGLSNALNAGFAQARGHLLTWTSDDNVYLPNALEVLAHCIAEQSADFVYAQCAAIDGDGQRTGGRVQLRPARMLALGNCIGACFLYRRAVYQAVGEFDTQMALAEDYDYWARVSRRFTMRMLDDELYLYRFHDAALTSTKGQQRVDDRVEAVRGRHFSPAEIGLAEGLRAYDRGEGKQARKLLLRTVLRSPFYFAAYKPLALATLPQFLLRFLVGLKKRTSDD